MQNMTIGKKIALGFGTLIFIAALLGGMAVFSMKSVRGQAQTLAESFVPETQIATDLQGAFAQAALAARSYGYTAEPAFLDAARKALEEVHHQQVLAQKLSEAHPELVKLQENLRALDPALQSYEELITQTETKNKDIAATREKMNGLAADFIAYIDTLIVSEQEKLASELKTNTEPAKLQERANQLALANDIRGAGNAARIAAFKSQALRDSQLIEEGLTNFDVMNKKFEVLSPLLHTQENIDQMARVKVSANAYREAMKQIMADDEALSDVAMKRLEAISRVNELLNDTQDTGMKRTVEAANVSTQKLTSASWTMILGLVVALAVGFTVAFFIIRNSNRVLTAVAHALDDGSNQVSAASGQVSAASQTLAEGSSQQASSLEETSSSLEEMASMTKRNSENARKANDLAKEARDAADKGVGDMQTMAAAMAAIKVSSDDIAKIIKTIDEIAFQTNILALNAAVEAARAGEAGMGFAVVADEVRNLSQRCAQAAKETSGKIEGAIIKTGQGVEITGKVAAALNEIVTKVRQVDELVTEVANASREQTEGITQINTAVGQMDKVTQSNAATAEESAAAAEELNSQAEVMKHSVADLLQLVGGKSEAPVRRPSAANLGRTQESQPAKAAASRLPAFSANGHNGNGNGHAPQAPSLTAANGRRSEIPLDGDFKDF
jgi:methyl-accepting chemotaxis protein